MRLEAQDLARRFRDRWLLRRVSLAITGGDRIAIVGPTGSGKTLLLRALAMLDPLDSGTIIWNGSVVHGHSVPPFRSRVIYLHQRPALLEGTVQDNLELPFALRVHRDRRFDRSRIVAWLQSLGRSEDFLSKRQRNLSGGESQLAALLRAIQFDPDILLLDEPTAALDRQATGVVETLVANWMAEDAGARATVWVTHDSRQAERVATKHLQMNDGQLV